jgi:hypothetical protein
MDKQEKEMIKLAKATKDNLSKLATYYYGKNKDSDNDVEWAGWMVVKEFIRLYID